MCKKEKVYCVILHTNPLHKDRQETEKVDKKQSQPSPLYNKSSKTSLAAPIFDLWEGHLLYVTLRALPWTQSGCLHQCLGPGLFFFFFWCSAHFLLPPLKRGLADHLNVVCYWLTTSFVSPLHLSPFLPLPKSIANGYLPICLYTYLHVSPSGAASQKAYENRPVPSR